MRAHLPNHEPWRAWSNFEFIGDEGRVNEVDLLVLTPDGLVLEPPKALDLSPPNREEPHFGADPYPAVPNIGQATLKEEIRA